jgi:hypothetical protein
LTLGFWFLALSFGLPASGFRLPAPDSSFQTPLHSPYKLSIFVLTQNLLMPALTLTIKDETAAGKIVNEVNISFA